MGTRSNIQFVFPDGRKYQIYKHWDGYPSYMINHILKFVKWNEGRNDDGEYAIANYFVWAKLDSVIHELNLRSFEGQFKNVEEYFKAADQNDGLHTGFGLTAVTDPTQSEKWIEWFYIVNFGKKEIQIYTDKLVETIPFEIKLTKKFKTHLEKISFD